MMALPATPLFESLLSTLTLDRPRDESGWVSLEVVQPRMLVNESSMASSTPVVAWARRAGELTLVSLSNRLAKELAVRGHPRSEKLAKVIIAIFAQVARGAGTDALNRLLDTISPVDCTTHLILSLPLRPASGPYQIGPFRLGALDREKLQYWCEKVGCDYFTRYPSHFRNEFAIQREPLRVFILDVEAVRAEAKTRGCSISPELLDTYFELLTEAVRSDFDEEFGACQEVFVAAGAGYLDTYDVRTVAGATFCALYYAKRNASNWGYFCPQGTGLTLDWGKPDQGFVAVARGLKERFGFEGTGAGETYESLLTFSRFFSKARVHEVRGRIDEAFLHYVIALDLLLGTRVESTQTVCRRSAALFAAAGRQPFAGALELMKALYDVRSRYVHGGISVDGGAVEQIKPVLGVVFDSLMRRHGRPEERAAGATERWCTLLDLTAAAFDAGRAPTDDDLALLGLITPR